MQDSTLSLISAKHCLGLKSPGFSGSVLFSYEQEAAEEDGRVFQGSLWQISEGQQRWTVCQSLSQLVSCKHEVVISLAAVAHPPYVSLNLYLYILKT